MDKDFANIEATLRVPATAPSLTDQDLTSFYQQAQEVLARGLTEPALALGAGKDVIVPPLHLREADEVGKALLKASKMLQHAKHQATHDTLTGLANRALFTEVLNQQLYLCERNRTNLSVLYIDLDGFKAVNDTHGHAFGDELLQLAAERQGWR